MYRQMDFKELLGVVGRIQEAIEGADAVKATMRTRMEDYGSVLQALQGSAPGAFKHELERLQGLFTEVEDLHAKYTADPQDGRPAKIAKRINRGTQHESIGETLDAIDRDVVRQFTAIAAKSSTNADEINTVLANLRPPSLPDMAAVPAGALALPPSYVERPAKHEAADGLINPEKAAAPYTVVGMGGRGKTVLASAVVRSSSVREHFRGGIFWMRVGRGASKNLLPLLQGLVREMGAAPTDAPHGVPHALDNLEQIKHHLSMVASTGSFPRLVVLDDVWEREVVDVFLPLGLKVLVTTRDRSVVGVPGDLLELGDMTEDEALELLRRTSMAVGQPGDDVRKQMTKVIASPWMTDIGVCFVSWCCVFFRLIGCVTYLRSISIPSKHGVFVFGCPVTSSSSIRVIYQLPPKFDPGCCTLRTSSVGARHRGFHARRERKGLDGRRVGRVDQALRERGQDDAGSRRPAVISKHGP